MLAVDTSALVSLGIAECHDHLLTEFDVHTTETVLEELGETSDHDDVHATAAEAALETTGHMTVHDVDADVPRSSRIDAGEGSCVVLSRSLDADFLLTDDLRALPELQRLVEAEVAISPIVLRALVDRGTLAEREARKRLERIAETRSWLGAPIYRRARDLFEDG